MSVCGCLIASIAFSILRTTSFLVLVKTVWFHQNTFARCGRIVLTSAGSGSNEAMLVEVSVVPRRKRCLCACLWLPLEFGPVVLAYVFCRLECHKRFFVFLVPCGACRWQLDVGGATSVSMCTSLVRGRTNAPGCSRQHECSPFLMLNQITRRALSMDSSPRFLIGCASLANTVP